LEVQNSLLFLEVSEVVDSIPGKGLSQLDGASSADFEPVSRSSPEHLRGEILEATPAEDGLLSRLLNQGDSRLIVGHRRAVELFLPRPKTGPCQLGAVLLVPG
jgi:hypothetical protein